MFFGTPWYVKLAGASGIGAFTTITGFFVYTKHCHMGDLPVTDPLFASSFYKKFNPNGNPSMRDVCVRRIPLAHLRPDLLEDAKTGGGKLVEAFCGSIFSSKGYTIQRIIHSRNKPPSTETSALIETLSQAHATARTTPTQSPPPTQISPSSSWTSALKSLFSSPSPPSPSTSTSTPPTLQVTPPLSPQPTELWTKPLLAKSPFPPSTIITNHFLVLSRHPPTSILLRCGDSPLTSPSSPRSSDGLFELSATANMDTGYAEFTLKSIFYNGEAQLSPEEKFKMKPMGPSMEWLHRQYTKLWMETGVGGCRLSKWRSFEKQKELIREEMRREEEELKKSQEGGGRLLEEKK